VRVAHVEISEPTLLYAPALDRIKLAVLSRLRID
jgi:hypothetical protein